MINYYPASKPTNDSMAQAVRSVTTHVLFAGSRADRSAARLLAGHKSRKGDTLNPQRCLPCVLRPCGLHKQGKRSDQVKLTGQLVVEAEFSMP